MRVRVAAVGALVGMLETLPQDLRRSKAMPRLRQLCQENANEAEMARCLGRLMPTIFAKVQPLVGDHSCESAARTHLCVM